MFRYLAEPRNILTEPVGSVEPRLKNTALCKDHLLNNHHFLGDPKVVQVLAVLPFQAFWSLSAIYLAQVYLWDIPLV